MGALRGTSALAMLVAAAVLWSLGGVLVKWVEWHPLAIAGARSGVAAVCFLAMMGRRPRFTRNPAQWGAALVYAVTVVSLVAATKLTTAANAILLQYTAPIYVALLAPWMLKEPTRPGDWALVLMAVMGVGLFFLDELTLAGWWGNLLGLVSGLSFGLLIILLRKQKESSPFESVLLGNVIAFAACLPFTAAPWPSAMGWLALLALGAVQLALPYYLYARAITRVPALAAVIITTLEPVLNPVWVAWGVGELPGPWAVAGGGLVIAAVTGRALMLRRRAAAARAAANRA